MEIAIHYSTILRDCIRHQVVARYYPHFPMFTHWKLNRENSPYKLIYQNHLISMWLKYWRYYYNILHIILVPLSILFIQNIIIFIHEYSLWTEARPSGQVLSVAPLACRLGFEPLWGGLYGGAVHFLRANRNPSPVSRQSTGYVAGSLTELRCRCLRIGQGFGGFLDLCEKVLLP
jgi:hypothetical protein